MHGNGNKQQKTRKKLFEDIVTLAKKEYGTSRSAMGCGKKLKRLKSINSKFADKCRTSGTSGDDPEILKQPEFYFEMYELEKDFWSSPSCFAIF